MEGKLCKSGYLQSVKIKDMQVVWHSLFGYPQIMNNNSMELLNRFNIPTTANKIIAAGGFEKIKKNIKSLRSCYFIIPENFNERGLLEKNNLVHERAIVNGASIEYLSLIISEACNFACSYCISSSMIEASYRHKKKRKMMDIETAKKAIDVFLSILKKNGKFDAYINFGGGEPLLNWKVIKEVLAYCQKKYAKKFSFTFRINTNASLVNAEIVEMFKLHNVKVALSLDGLGKANDIIRISKSGYSAFKQIISAMNIFAKLNYNLGGFSSTVTSDNFNLINENLIEFAARRNFDSLRLDLDVIHMLPIPVDTAIKKIMALKRFAKKKGIHMSGFWERPVENLNSSVLEKHIAFCGGVAGKSLCVSPSQEVFICGYSASKLANLLKKEILLSKTYKNIVFDRLAGRLKRCHGCIIEGQCMGGCYITEEFSGLTNNAALNYNCNLYRKITVELLKDSLKEALF